ncbi:MAG TPA: ATP-binding protein [Candidatus Acidoferrales bacterium]|jgi:serine/threonine-protein kinase RsbW|nr:ATP-binding protein [Candidatus Acidoferrales bacterium]
MGRRLEIPGKDKRYEVSLPGRVDAISPAVDEIMAHLHTRVLTQENAFAIETALREALANAVLHGCKADATKQVHCEVSWNDDGGIEILVRDPGEGFDPNSLSDPIRDENLRADHGRGIYLIRHLMDKVEHLNGGRAIRMRKS